MIDKIKKGLECCINWETGCTECPYDNLPHDECVAAMKTDALVYIEQLKRERDAAVEQLKHAGNACSSCAHGEKDSRQEPCKSCWPIQPRFEHVNWEWIGVREVE